MVLQDTDLKNPGKTRQGKASKRREDQREDKENKKWQGLRGFFTVEQGVRNKRLWFRLRVKVQA